MKRIQLSITKEYSDAIDAYLKITNKTLFDISGIVEDAQRGKCNDSEVQMHRNFEAALRGLKRRPSSDMYLKQLIFYYKQIEEHQMYVNAVNGVY